MMDFRSNKSKRVATSTMHSETLSKLNGVEGGTYIQSYLLELEKPHLKCIELLEPEAHSEMIPLCSITDCDDLHAALTSPACPNPTNKQLSLYLSCLREYKLTRRIEAFIWVDTRDMLANALTKIEDSGVVPLEILPSCLRSNSWFPVHPYKWNSTWATDA